jgi:ATP-dependent RNA helicase RhlE
MTFNDLNLTTPLLNVLEELEYLTPTPIQSKAFSVIMSGRDLIGIAQTGTGKTFAYLLPILRQHTYSEQRHPRVLIVVPTRELVIQVVGEIEKLTKYINIRYAGVYGGTNINTQKQLVYNGLDILVATPGRLLDLNLTGVLRLKNIQKFIIDEVDEMLNLGFRPALISIMELLPEKRQNLMFSATLTPEVSKIISDFFDFPNTIEIAPHGTPLEQIIQKAYRVPNYFTKVNMLFYLLTTNMEMNKVLVFTGTKKLADRLFEDLTTKNIPLLGVIHSNKSQNNRIHTIQQFENGEIKVLIATDLISRGLDITDITHVINFDMPEVAADYIHRIGRTGRADKAGTAISFINDVELVYQQAIETLMKKTIPMEKMPSEVEVSTIFSLEEKPIPFDKNYVKVNKNKESKGAFHEKLEKNKKVNLGGLAKKKKREKRFR